MTEVFTSSIIWRQRGRDILVLVPTATRSSSVGGHYFIEPVFNSLSRKEKT